MRTLALLSVLFGGVSGAKNVTFDGLSGISGLINVQGQQRGEVVWHKIGQPIDQSSLNFKSLFEVLQVNITSTNVANIKVIFNGGTEIPWLDPPDTTNPLYQSVYRKYCASWFGGSSSVNCENVLLPRFGIWAPFGATKVAVVQDASDSIDYSITFRKQYDQKRAFRLAVGMFLFLFGSLFSHSRPMHYLVGTALGSVGFILVLLFVGLRVVPGNKPAFAMVGAASATFGAWLYNTVQEAFLVHVGQYLMYYVALMIVGGGAGFAYTYKHPLDANSQFLCLLFIRIFAAGLIIFEGPTSFFVSFIIIAALCLFLLLSRCGPNLWACLCDRKPDAPLPAAPDSKPDGNELVSEEVLFRRPVVTAQPKASRSQDYNANARRPVTPARAYQPPRAYQVPRERTPAPPAPPATPLAFDPREVPLPPISPDYLLPPAAPHFDFSPAINETALLEELEGKFREVGAIIQTMKKRSRPPVTPDDEPFGDNSKFQRI